MTENNVKDLDQPLTAEVARDEGRERPKQKKRDRHDVHGWVVLDKPVGMTSTHAVSVVKRLFNAKRAGHAGTLDPLASGALPIALGEATKTVPFVMDGRKLYRFTVRWGEERDTDDAEGRIIAQNDQRPSPDAIGALLPSFTGSIQQVPPRYSAIKIEGERAYDLARDGETVELMARPVDIGRLDLVSVPQPGPLRPGGGMRQGDLRALACPRSWPRFGLFWPCQRPPAGRSWAIRRRNHDFAGTSGGSMS